VGRRFVIKVAVTVVFTLALAPTPAVVATPSGRFGVQLVRAGSWLGGRGVTVYSNGSSHVHCGPGTASCRSRIGPRGDVDAGMKWQCVELAQRLYITLGWYPRRFGVAYAYQIWSAAPRIGMTRVPNGALWPGSIHPGDMIVWRPSGDVGFAGHVAIVDTVVGTQVAVKEQNWGRATDQWDVQRGRSVYALARGRLSGHGLPPSDIYGIVHSPKDHLRNLAFVGSRTVRSISDGSSHDGFAPVTGSTGARRM
jgi:hypothetical protein